MVIHPVEYRYGSYEMKKIFSRENWVKLAVKVEFSLLKALRNIGIISISEKELLSILDKFNKVTYEDVMRYENITKHETMALVKILSQLAGEYGRYIHLGLTSNDVLDNVLMLQVKKALNIILDKLDILIDKLVDIAREEKSTPILGRTHGRAAIPVTYGFKLCLYLDELSRVYKRLKEDRKYIAGKIGGAVGTQVELYPDMSRIEELVLNDLELDRASFYTQIIPRDRLAYILTDLSILSSILDQFANEIRNLQRSEIDELEEGFEFSQIGSSIMPHKRNPIRSEKICGLARVIRSFVTGILENIVLEHERDLTNSSFERVVVPEIFLLVDEQLDTLNKVIDSIVIVRENALNNIKRFTPEIYSDLLVQLGTLNGGDRQIIHDKLRRLFAIEGVSNTEELIEKISKDAYLREYLSPERIMEALSLTRYQHAAESQVDKLLNSMSKG